MRSQIGGHSLSQGRRTPDWSLRRDLSSVGAIPKPVQHLPHLLFHCFIQHLVKGRLHNFLLLAEVEPAPFIDEILPLCGLKDILKIV